MPSYSKINKVIQNKLNSKRKILSRQGSSDIFSPSDKDSRKQHQQNVIKTPYIIMVSTDKLQDKESNKIGNDDFFMLSNQEYSKNNLNIKVGTDLYNARSLEGKTEVPYRPAPGIKDLTSEFISTNNTQFNRQVTVNFTCYSLADLEELNERFMSLERKVYVQWGWATDEKITPLIKPDGKIDYSGSDPENKKTQIARLQEEVITKGQGDFDAVIGFVKQFSFSLREDGGFDCTTELLAQGINIMDTPLQQGGEGDSEVIKKGLQYGSYSAQFSGFLQEVNNLQDDAVDLLTDSGTQRNIYEGKEAVESVQTTTDSDNNIAEVNLLNASTEGKSFVYNENFILTKTNKTSLKNIDIKGENALSYQSFSVKEKINDINTAQTLNTVLPGGSLALSLVYNSMTNREKTIDPNECWVRWGWFEDNLLNKYFALYGAGNEPFSYYRSIEDVGELDEEIVGEIKITKSVPSARGDRLETKEVSTSVTSSVDFESIKVNNQKDFITTDIKQFLFPGKFGVGVEKIEGGSELARQKYLSAIAKSQKLYEKKQNIQPADGLTADQIYQRNLRDETSEEYQLSKEIETLQQEQQDILAQNRFADVEELKKIIAQSRISLDNLDNITETGFDKYLFLYELEQITKDTKKIKSFNIDDKSEEGYLRNIFINIGHLQSIFGEATATTLGETMNILFSSLAGNTVNEIDLITRYDTKKGDGRYGAEPRKPGESPSYPVSYDKDSAKGDIYEFPVHQQDSIVLSQEIATDLTNTQMQVLMSKNLSAQVKKQLDKKGVSPEHVVDFTQTNAKGEKIPGNKYDRTVGLQPAFLKYGLNYKNPKGANEDWPIALWAGSIDKGDDSGQELVRNEEIGNKVEKANEQTEKDLESASNKFSIAPIKYTIDGKLKAEAFKEMTDSLNIEVKEKEDENGDKKPIIFPKVSDFGLIGLTTTLTLTGIAGLYPSNVFTTSYLPTKFKINNIGGEKSSCHFWTTGVTQNCSAESWTTQLEARMAWRHSKDE